MIYLAVVITIALIFQVYPKICRIDVATLRIVVFSLWFLSGLWPAAHWFWMFGGFKDPGVQIIFPRTITCYFIIVLAFSFYISKMPERFFPGAMDYFGHSHQWWHLLIFLALATWHDTAIRSAIFRNEIGCSSQIAL